MLENVRQKTKKKQKKTNFLMLGVNEVIDFSLSDIKKLRHFYVLTKCPLVFSNVLFSKRL